MLKRGEAQNELTRYRYDVVLTKTRREVGEVPVVRWGLDHRDVGDALMWAEVESVNGFWLNGIPNGRLSADLTALRELTGQPHVEVSGVQPELVMRAGEAAGYRTRAQWSEGGDDHTFDVLFIRGPLNEGDFEPTEPSSLVVAGDLRRHFNRPVAGQNDRVPQSRR
ncbi:hypothetical protein GCM10029964_055480 [Kibdelosporangium lantanae]